MSKDALDIRAFITAPFVRCEHCGQQQSGVLTISDRSYSRRCRNCLRLVNNIPLPQIRKRIIYLDQFVISNLVKLENPALQRNSALRDDPFWAELRDTLADLRKHQLLVCPDSPSHERESRIAPFPAELKKMYEHLSSGITFAAFETIESAQICELATAWAQKREPAFDFASERVLSANPHRWSERFYITFGENPFLTAGDVQTARTQVHTHIAHLFQDVWRVEKRTFAYWYELERNSYKTILGQTAEKARRERAEALMAYRPGEEPSLENLGRVLISPAEALLMSILEIFRLSGDEETSRSNGEIEELARSFGGKNRIADAPFVKIQALMYAAIAMRAAAGQKEPPDEGMATDVDTVAHLLPYCDAMFMDNECRSLLLNIPGRYKPKETEKVYSLSNRTGFLKYLQSIKVTMSETHRQTLREVYGVG